jgi:hypothetical protein
MTLYFLKVNLPHLLLHCTTSPPILTLHGYPHLPALPLPELQHHSITRLRSQHPIGAARPLARCPPLRAPPSTSNPTESKKSTGTGEAEQDGRSSIQRYRSTNRRYGARFRGIGVRIEGTEPESEVPARPSRTARVAPVSSPCCSTPAALRSHQRGFLLLPPHRARRPHRVPRCGEHSARVHRQHCGARPLLDLLPRRRIDVPVVETAGEVRQGGRSFDLSTRRAPPGGLLFPPLVGDGADAGETGEEVECASHEGVKRLTKVALASLHNRERSWAAFPRMQASTLLLHLGSLHKALCSLPNIGGLHSISLDRPYAGCQSHPM